MSVWLVLWVLAQGLTLKQLEATNSLLGGEPVYVVRVVRRVSNSTNIISAINSLSPTVSTNLVLVSQVDEIALDETIVLGDVAYSHAIAFILEGNKQGKRVTLRCRKAKTALHITTKTLLLSNVDITGCTRSAITVNTAFPNCTTSPDLGSTQCDPPVVLSYMTLHANSAPKGGGIHLQAGPLYIKNFRIENNAAEEGGGAYASPAACLLAEPSDDPRVRFRGNTAERGGALFHYDGVCGRKLGSRDPVSGNVVEEAFGVAGENWANAISDMVFEGNHARREGGALYGVQRYTDSDRLYLEALVFVGNTAGQRGGAVYFQNLRECLTRNLTFTANRAGLAGGAIWVASTIYGTLELREARLHHNKVDLSLFTSTPPTPASLSTRALDAGNGGAVYASGSITFKSTNHTNYTGNHAPLNGGALHCSWCTYILFAPVNGSRMVNNTACSGGAISLDSVTGPSNISSVAFNRNGALCDPGAVRAARAAAAGPGGEATVESLLVCGAGGGGGACVRSLSVLRLSNNTFDRNQATNGGGLYVRQDGCARMPTLCDVAIVNHTLSGNTAKDAGGGIYLTSLARVTLPLPPLPAGPNTRHLAPQTTTTPAYTTACAAAAQTHAKTFANSSSTTTTTSAAATGGNRLSANTVGSGGYGPAVATAVSCMIQEAAGSVTVRNDEPFTLVALAYDAFGQQVTLGSQVLVFSVGSSNPDVTLRSPTAQNVTPAGLALQGMSLNTANSYRTSTSLRIRATLSDASSSTAAFAAVVVDVVGCRPGSVRSGNTCKACGAKEYTFDEVGNNGECWVCPDGAVCGNATLVPQDGFWHSGPYSSGMHRCPLKWACALGEADVRVRALRRFQEEKLAGYNDAAEGERLQIVLQYNVAQCGKGYTGNVCGNCAERYGRRSGSRCERCPGKLAAWAVFVGLKVLEVLFVAMLVAARLRRPPVRNMLLDGSSGLVKSLATDADDDQKASLLVRLKVAGYILIAAASSNLAALAEVLMVHLQLCGLLRATEVEWPPALNTFLKALGLPFATVTWLSPDCLLAHDSDHLAIKRVLLTTLTPVATTVLLVGIWLAVATWRQRATAGRTHLLHSGMVVAVSSAAFYYPAVVNAVMSIFTCYKLDGAHAAYGGLPSVAAATLGWWKQDYSAQCFRGTHLAFALAYGVPMLVLVVLGIPAYITYFLWRHHRRGDFEHNDAFRERFQFMFGDFRGGCWFWFPYRFWLLLVMSAATQVPSFYGAVRQVTTMGICLSAFILMHMAARPYTSKLVNATYSAALNAVLATVILSFTIASPRTSDDSARTTMALVIAINTAAMIEQLAVMLLGLATSGARLQTWAAAGAAAIVRGRFFRPFLRQLPRPQAAKSNTQPGGGPPGGATFGSSGPPPGGATAGSSGIVPLGGAAAGSSGGPPSGATAGSSGSVPLGGAAAGSSGGPPGGATAGEHGSMPLGVVAGSTTGSP